MNPRDTDCAVIVNNLFTTVVYLFQETLNGVDS